MRNRSPPKVALERRQTWWIFQARPCHSLQVRRRRWVVITFRQQQRRYWKRTLLLKTHYDTLGVLVDFRHKLIVDRPTGGRWLFDLSQDPLEQRNLIDAEPERARRLEEALRREAREHMVFLGGLERSRD